MGIRIYLLDNYRGLLESLSTFDQADADLEVVDTASEGCEAFGRTNRLGSDHHRAGVEAGDLRCRD